jgi:hypothetical protein
MQEAAKTMCWDELAHSIMILETAVIYMLDPIEKETYKIIIEVLENEKVTRVQKTPTPTNLISNLLNE